MTMNEALLLGEIHALAAAVQEQVGRLCTVSASHHPRFPDEEVPTLHVRASISDYDDRDPIFHTFTGEREEGLRRIRDELTDWLCQRKQEDAA